MRCQRCGFEIEPGQTFCSMCGTEQAKALRAKKRKIKSIFGVIKVASNNHLKMWINLFLAILVAVFILVVRKDSPVLVACICLVSLLLGYLLFQCLLPYKNPNASKSKKYKLGVKVSFVLLILLFLLSVFAGSSGLLDLARKI